MKPSLHHFIDEHGTVTSKVCDVLEWADWFENNRMCWHLVDHHADVRVSTVFLGLDHSFGLQDGPILFETMIFGGPHDGYQKRYRTTEEAKKGHKAACALALPYDERKLDL